MNKNGYHYHKLFPCRDSFFPQTVRNICLRAQILREYINKMNPVVITYACFNNAVYYLKPHLRLHNHKVESSIPFICLFRDIWHRWQNYKKKHMSTLTYLTFDKYWFLCYEVCILSERITTPWWQNLSQH